MTYDETQHPRAGDGKFAEKVRPEETDVVLSTPLDRDALLTEALGDGDPLTEDQQRLLAVITDADNHDFVGGDTDFEAILEELDTHGDDTSFYGAERIADLLYAHYQRQPGPADRAGDFNFDLNRTGDGEVGSYTVGVYLGHSEAAYLSKSADSKYLDADRHLRAHETSGLRKALVLAEVIDGDFQRIRSKAERLGLIPNPDSKPGQPGQPDLHEAQRSLSAFTKAVDSESGDKEIDAAHDMHEALSAYVAADRVKPPVWPQNDHERLAFEDYKTEVANGDDASSFRTWYENRYGGDKP